MKYYAVQITDVDSTGEMKIACENAAKARAEGCAYIRRWNLPGGTVDSVREITKSDFWTGRRYEDAPGRKYTVEAVDEGRYCDIFRLRPRDGGEELTVSAYELEHYYRPTI